MRRVPLRGRRWLSQLVGPACAGLGLCGCAGWWDDVRSRDFSFKTMFQTENPYVVLQESNDGDKRAKALRALPAPGTGGDAREQDTVLKVLETTATEDRLALCRLAAIQKLGESRDPRAVPVLVKSFYSARASKLFPSETINIIECHALAALGQTKQTDAVEHLVLVVREPPIAADATQEEKQHSLDRRTAAARALGNFNHYQATEALVMVLKNEKDVALRDRAHESLQLATGKKLPAEARAWENLLHGNPDPESKPEDASSGDHILARFRTDPERKKQESTQLPPADPGPSADGAKRPAAEQKPPEPKKPREPARGLLFLNNNMKPMPQPGPADNQPEE